VIKLTENAQTTDVMHKIALKLVARGRVVRSEDGRAAIEIHQYEFRTQGSQGNGNTIH